MKKLLGVILITLSIGLIVTILAVCNWGLQLLWWSHPNELIFTFGIFSVALYITFIVNGMMLSIGLLHMYGFPHFSVKKTFIGLIKIETILALLYFMILLGLTYTDILGKEQSLYEKEPWHLSSISLHIMYLYFIFYILGK